MGARKISGFTLIELMVVVAIVGILAAIALPSFANQVRKSRRTAAMTTLQDQQLRLERYRVDNASFATYTLPSGLDTSYYVITFPAASASATGYTLTATPQGDQAIDPCGTLNIINTAGTVTKTAAASNCW